MALLGGFTAGEAGAKLERALREIEQLKVDQQVAVEKRDKQVSSHVHCIASH